MRGGGDRAHRRRLRAAVPAAEAPRRAGGHRRQPRGRGPARSVREHGLRRSLAARAGRRRATRSARSASATRRRSSCSTGTPRRASARPPIAGGSSRRSSAAKVTAGAHALRPGAQAGRKHPRALDAAAARGDPDLRLPEVGLDRRRKTSTSPKHDADARCRSASDKIAEHRGAVGHLRPLVVLEPGARHASPPASPTRASTPATNVPVALEIDGQQIETQDGQHRRRTPRRRSPSRRSRSPSRRAHGVVRAGTDALPPTTRSTSCSRRARRCRCWSSTAATEPTSSFYLTRALGIGTTPTFQVEDRAGGARHAADARAALGRRPERHDAAARASPAARSSGSSSAAAGCSSCSASTAPGRRARPTSCRARSAPSSIGPTAAAATIGFRDYSHPVFEVFKAPRSGDFSAARVLRYRALETGPDDRVLARFDDGAVAAAERRVGTGRVIALDDDARRLVERPGAEAGLPAARAPARRGTSVSTSSRRRGRRSARSSTCRAAQEQAPTASS